MAKKRNTKYWGFDVSTIDKAVHPGDDFYRHANGNWIKRNTIPPTEAWWGTVNILRYKTERQLKNIVFDLSKKRYPKGTSEQLISDFYRSASDMKRRNALGAKPLKPFFEKIEKIRSVNDLLDTIAYFHLIGIDVVWDTSFDQDCKNSNAYMLHLCQGGLGMPEREYYIKSGEEQKRVRDAYVEHIGRHLVLAGKKKDEIARLAKVILRVETALARASMRKEDTRDLEKTYNKKNMKGLSRMAPGIDWKRYFSDIGAGRISSVIVMQPKFFSKASGYLKSISLSDWKVYLEWQVINGVAPLLSTPFVQEHFNFYGTALTGAKKMKPLWRRSLSVTNAVLGEPLGKIYVKRHFSPEAKRLVNDLVSDLFVAYEARIRHLDWMSDATKKKALKKLRAMGRKIGYPDRWESYKGLRIKPDDFFGNVLRAQKFEHKKEMRRIHKPVERHRWFMTPQTVNAYCHLNLNEIVFPAAYLQGPHFDAKADAGVNYGAVGYTIGHEMTHGFDDQGSKFDAKGNMKRWWSKADYKRFQKKGRGLVEQFNKYEVAPGVNVNGKMTLGENIADLGGLAIAFDAYMLRLQKSGRENIDGFTPEQRFFLGFAQGERELIRDEFLKTVTLIDPHSPSHFRANGPLSNFAPFYKEFGITPKHKLYRAPKDRVEIW